MKFQQLIQAAQFRIVEGSPHLWDCYGNNARYLDLLSENNYSELSIIFDVKTQDVYQANLKVNDDYFIWFNPSFEKSYKDEAKERDVNPLQVYDDKDYVEVVSFEPFVLQVINGFK